MNKPRLRTLAAHLLTIKPKNFHIGAWVETNSCGTVACAFGHAALIEEFKSQGLHLDELGIPCLSSGARGIKAAAEFFEINHPLAYNLFMPTGYPDISVKRDVRPSDVAKKILQVIGDKE